MNILLFGITREIIGKSQLCLEKEEKPLSVSELMRLLKKEYPELNTLSSLSIAVNNQYVTDDMPLEGNEEIALIPPVSGG